MTRSTVSTSPVALSRAAHVARLKLLCDSDFERAWLDWAAAANLRLPDKADIAVKDAAINRCPEDAGYSVVRFPKEQAAWPDVVRRHAWLFGEMEH